MLANSKSRCRRWNLRKSVLDEPIIHSEHCMCKVVVEASGATDDYEEDVPAAANEDSLLLKCF